MCSSCRRPRDIRRMGINAGGKTTPSSASIRNVGPAKPTRNSTSRVVSTSPISSQRSRITGVKYAPK